MCFLDRTQLIIAISQLCHKHNCKHIINKYIKVPMKLWKDDAELFSIAKKELFPALVGDILDKMGYIHQFVSPHIKPLRSDMVVVGRAMPVLEADVFAEEPYCGKLRELNNVILTPHCASNTIESREKMEIEALNNLLKGFDYLL